MACSAIYFLDNKGKVLISRNYRGDIENSVIDKFIGDTLFYFAQVYSILMIFSRACIRHGGGK